MIKIVFLFLFSLSMSFATVNPNYSEFNTIDKQTSTFLTLFKRDYLSYKKAQESQAKKEALFLEKKIRFLGIIKKIKAYDKALDILKKEQSTLEKSMVKKNKIKKQKKKLLQKTKIQAKKIQAKKIRTKKIRAKLVAKIDISQQRMKVYRGKKMLYNWKVSTGRKGYRTPTGYYKVKKLRKGYRSRKYGNASMPYAVFFKSAYAIHGTRSVRRLGRPASHGCVRLHTANAKKFYTLVRKIGRKNTSIHIVH